jgi:VWFA-related protein
MMKNLRFLFCSSTLLMIALAQTPQKSDFSIKVGVEEVRIDAVVLDSKGNPITDLTANDFKVYQDSDLQKLESCVYIADVQKREKTAVSPEAAKAEALISKTKLSKDKVQRAIAFRVALRGSDPRPPLRNFVENFMEPGDLVAILGAGPQKFTSDKRELLSSIDHIWGDFSCIELAKLRTMDVAPTSISQVNANWFIPDENFVRQYKAAIAPIRYAVRALQEMPGRKYLVLMSDDLFSDALRMPTLQARLINEAANEAWRAGVVILTWDLCHAGGNAARSNPLYRKTGGINFSNSNFLYKGKPALDALSGYYLLSYIPPARTFEKKRRDKYHKITVEVKRPGAQVHSRDGFYGSPGASEFATVSPANTLRQAMFSPLLYNDLTLSLSSGYAHAPASGYFLRSLIHLDGKDLTFTEDKNGEHSLALELQALTSDTSGMIQDTKAYRYDFTLSDADIARIRRNGIDLKTYLPVRYPGDYYVSAGIKDRASGRIGTGYQFLQIPDLTRLTLSLSSIFLLENERDKAVIKTGNIEDPSGSLEAMRKWKALKQSPAIRIYKPGDRFDYMTVLYNAKTKEGPAQNLELQSTLFKNGQVYRRETLEEISLDRLRVLENLPIAKTLVFDSNMEEGDYLLQVSVTDKTPKKPRTAIQAIDFQIRK